SICQAVQRFLVPLSGEVGRAIRPVFNGSLARYQLYATGDGGHLAVAPLEEKFWKRFAEKMKIPSQVLLEGEGGAVEWLKTRFREKKLKDWLEELNDPGLCVTPGKEKGRNKTLSSYEKCPSPDQYPDRRSFWKRLQGGGLCPARGQKGGGARRFSRADLVGVSAPGSFGKAPFQSSQFKSLERGGFQDSRDLRRGGLRRAKSGTYGAPRVQFRRLPPRGAGDGGAAEDL